MSGFLVHKPGPYTTVQDGGRFGVSHFGLSEGGPMDRRSFVIANRLLDNEPTAAALEVTFGGLELAVLENTCIAVTGAFCPLTINGKNKSLWQTHSVKKGDVLSLGFAGLGVRAYLAVRGGFKESVWFNSQSVVTREGLGAPLKATQTLSFEPYHHTLETKLDFQKQPSLRKKAVLDFVEGYQWSSFRDSEKMKLLTHSYEVTKQNNRMGYRLEGPAVETGSRRLLSEGICAGAIQITGDGQPIVLMRDRQTIGGYPKAGSLTLESMDTLAQLTQGSKVTFQPISPDRAIEKRRKYEADMLSI